MIANTINDMIASITLRNISPHEDSDDVDNFVQNGKVDFESQKD